MVTCPVVELDPWADDVLVDPYPAYRELRELAPVVRLARYDAYAVAGYREARELLGDWETFSSAAGVGMSPEMNAKSGGILTTDPPAHDPLRRLLNGQLQARALTPHHDFITGEAHAVVGRLVAAGSFDAVVELAHAYSVRIVADLVGFPEEGRDRLVERSTAGFNTFGPDNALLRSSVPGLRDLLDYCAHVAQGNLAPDRWGAGILAAGRRGDVDPDACVGLLLAYAWAGMDTTVNALSMAVKLFADHPDQWELLRGDRALLPAAINEVLRLDPPVHRFTRATTRPTTLGGYELPGGVRVLVLFGAANRDPRRFPDPDRFDITRKAASHLGFGRGVHRCVGAPLALLEMDAVLTALLDRVAHIRLVDHQWRPNNALHGLARLVVEVEPDSAARSADAH